MPILRRESDIFPPALFSIPLEVAPWEIVHVRSRQEKVLARLLAEHRQPFYLPQIEKKMRRSNRAFTSFLALFPGYVFIRRTAEMRQVLWASGAVARVIPVEDQAQFQREIEQIRALQVSGAILVPGTELVPGDPVRIVSGVFSGYVGIVLRERDALRLVVSITALNKSVVAEFPREALSRAPNVARHQQ